MTGMLVGAGVLGLFAPKIALLVMTWLYHKAWNVISGPWFEDQFLNEKIFYRVFYAIGLVVLWTIEITETQFQNWIDRITPYAQETT